MHGLFNVCATEFRVMLWIHLLFSLTPISLFENPLDYVANWVILTLLQDHHHFHNQQRNFALQWLFIVVVFNLNYDELNNSCSFNTG